MRKLVVLIAVAMMVMAPAITLFAGGQQQGAAAATAAAAAGEIVNFATPAAYRTATGRTIATFSEAPTLAARVQSGQLPPVTQRLPEEYAVVAPLESIGTYGGSLRTVALGPTSGGADARRLRQQNLFAIDADVTEFRPNIAKSWEFAPDLKSITISLRKGLRWSDGQPVTVDDIMFAYEDVLMNTDITPVLAANLRPGNTPLKVVPIDEITFRIEFAVPYGPILNILALTDEPILLLPKHYLSRFHPRYNAQADAQAKAAGYAGWVQQFAYHRPIGQGQQEVGVPNLGSFVLSRVDSAGNKYFERNPYFFKVDTAGNQLPYLDEIVRVIVTDRQVRTLRILSGDIDVAGWDMPLSEWTLYKENETAGNYRATLWPQAVAARTAYDFNYGHKDEFLRTLFNDLRFRQAMSLGFDRDELNRVLAFGEARPFAATAREGTSFYEEWMGSYFIEYDPDRANALLDEIGLRWDANRRYRLRPDGQPISFTIETQHQVFVDYSEIVKEYWEKLGFRIEIRLQQQTLILARRDAGDVDVSVMYLGTSFEPIMFQNPGTFFISDGQNNASNKIRNDWADWITSNGANGVEPPEDFKVQYDLASRWLLTEPGSPQYLELGGQMITNYTRSLRTIGTLGMEPIPIIFKNGLTNTPAMAFWQGGPVMLMPFQAEQWYWRR